MDGLYVAVAAVFLALSWGLLRLFDVMSGGGGAGGGVGGGGR